MPGKMGDGMLVKDKVIQSGINVYKSLSRHVVLPVIQVKVETTKVCNLKCVGCRRNYAESIVKAPGPKHLTVGDLWQLCATTNMQYIRFEGDGEPTCNPHFRDLVKWCGNRGIRSAMTSNGTLLDKEYIKFLEDNGMVRIHISFDGARKDTFEKQRVGARYEQVLEVCKEIGKSKIQLFMNCVTFTDEIIGQLEEYVLLAQEAKASGVLILKFQTVEDFGIPTDWTRWSGHLEKVRKLAQSKDLIFLGTGETVPTFHECEDAYVCPYVVLGGDVYACSYMANMRTSEGYGGKVFPCNSSNYIVGNLNAHWMRDIWRNEVYKELRTTLSKSRRPNLSTLSKEELVTLKEETIDKDRFSYCVGCLCRWGESGI